MCAPLGRITVTYGPYNCTSCLGNRDLHTYLCVQTGPTGLELSLFHVFAGFMSYVIIDLNRLIRLCSCTCVRFIFWPRIFLLWGREKFNFLFIPQCFSYSGFNNNENYRMTTKCLPKRQDLKNITRKYNFYFERVFMCSFWWDWHYKRYSLLVGVAL
jgi:hypothetical protein